MKLYEVNGLLYLKKRGKLYLLNQDVAIEVVLANLMKEKT